MARHDHLSIRQLRRLALGPRPTSKPTRTEAPTAGTSPEPVIAQIARGGTR